MTNANFDFDEMMGKEVKDIVTGYTGIVTGKITWLFGCNQYGVMAKVATDGSVKESSWFDEGRLEVIGEGIRPQEVSAPTGKRGGCTNYPKNSRI
ncbi:MAG: hypothetical protein RR370_02600 [Synergistaceae bacterium]